MATYLSQTYIPNQPRTDENFQLLANIQMMKQQKYDINQEKLQQTLSAFGLQDVIRPQDKEYIAAKLSDLTNNINNLANRDLSSNGVVNDINAQIQAAAQDPNILAAIDSTYKFRNFNNQVNTIREKNPELYSDRNYNYALAQAGYQDYISGKTNTLGSLQYNNYSDYNKKINDLVVDLESKRKDQTIQVPDGRGGMIETTISGLSPTQLRSIAESMLDGNDQQQIKIDGWYNSNGYSPAALSTASRVIGTDISNTNSRIDALNLKIKNGGSANDLTKWNAELNTLSGRKAALEKNLQVFTSNPEAAATYLQQERVYNDVITRFAPLYTESQKIVKDDIYWAQKNYELDNKKYALEESKFDYEQQKDLREQQDALGNLIVTSAGLDPENTIESAEQEVSNTISAIDTNLNSVLSGYKSALETEAAAGNKEAQSVLNIYENRLANKSANQSDLDIFRAVVTETDSTNDNLSIINGVNYKAQIRGLTDDLDLYVTARTEAEQQSKISHVDATLNTPETFEAFFKNKETKMLWNGKAQPVYKVLQATGLMDAQGNKTGDIKANRAVLKALENSYYADDVLTNLGLPFGSGDERRSTTSSLGSLRKLAQSLGENPTDAYSVVTSGGGGDTLGRSVQRAVINPNSKTGQFLAQARANNIYDTFGFSDNSLSSDDATIGRFLKTDYRTNPEYTQSLTNLRNRLPNNQVIGIAPSQEKLYQKVQALASSVDNTFRPSKESTLNIRDAGDYVEVSATTFSTKGGQNIPNPDSVKISKADFQQNLPELSSRINFNSKSAVYTAEATKGKPLVSAPIKYLSDNANDNYEWATAELLRGKEQLVPYLTSTDSKNALQSQNSILIQQDPTARNVINQAINNSSDYSINLQLSSTFGTPKMYVRLLNKNTGETIHSVKLDNLSNADDFKPILDNAPQVFYSMVINDILNKQTFSINSGTNFEAYNKLKQSLKIE